MIGLRNRNEVEDKIFVPSTQAVLDYVGGSVAPFNGTISAIFAKLLLAGTTNSQVTDVLINGTSIFASGALTFASAATACTYGTFTNSPIKVNKGDLIRFNTSAVHDTPGKGLVVWITFRRGRDSKAAQACQTDTLASDSDAA